MTDDNAKNNPVVTSAGAIQAAVVLLFGLGATGGGTYIGNINGAQAAATIMEARMLAYDEKLKRIELELTGMKKEIATNHTRLIENSVTLDYRGDWINRVDAYFDRIFATLEELKIINATNNPTR